MLIQRRAFIPEREEALSLRYAGQSRVSSDHEEARGIGRMSLVHSAKPRNLVKEREPWQSDIR